MTAPAGGVDAVLGPTGVLIALGLVGLAMFLFVFLLNAWLRYQRARVRPPDAEENTVEASPAYRRYLVAAAWAGGSARDWDYSVRPVLGELVELAMAEQMPGADPRVAARELLGERIWPLVDRDARRSDDRGTPGAGREELLRILEQVENL